ncbi:hypothetical protein LMG23992_00287 [Cupriavidus laharis]|uniref:Uncharacterized protein n=1 Tax=Cupriavidus laharis TaxID=151654 RepID=A0ABN7XVL0_9BURK|nr:hypothetical protein [Cupriavidus laharis]CAG9165139.1 hypothetical protein LMG23992_00287 [Cupriavidus laharis]
MTRLLSDLAEHAGQLSLSILFMLLLTLVLYGETRISVHASALFHSLFPSGWR